MLTNENDLVYDAFAGSCVTGEVCEFLHRRWICSELVEEYLEGAKGRFIDGKSNVSHTVTTYSLHNPSAMWKGIPDDTISEDGGKKRTNNK